GVGPRRPPAPPRAAEDATARLANRGVVEHELAARLSLCRQREDAPAGLHVEEGDEPARACEGADALADRAARPRERGRLDAVDRLLELEADARLRRFRPVA